MIRRFGRLGSLRDVIAALTGAVAPVLNAFLIMLIVGSICAPERRRGRRGARGRKGRNVLGGPEISTGWGGLRGQGGWNGWATWEAVRGPERREGGR